MRAHEFVDEKIEPDTVKTGYRNKETINHPKLGQLTLTAEGEDRQVFDTQANVLHIRLLDSQEQELAWADFLVKTRREDQEQFLESVYTFVEPKYRGQGLAKIIYQYANKLGNDIEPSGLQTDLGKGMWKGLDKSVRQLKKLPQAATPTTKSVNRPTLWQRVKKAVAL